MSSSANWLERLGHATEYRELELIFSEIATAANNTVDGQQLAASIDEAILRIEQERLRDEEELRTFEQEYTAFKQQQQGVVGWFRRHMPFSQTRREELEHRGSIADQRAEILADNLIIARAQMVKERLLPPTARRLGLTPADWTAKLDASHSVPRFSEYLATVRGLTDELARSKLFVDQLHLDVEAFAKADFSQMEDRQRKKSDLAAARGELGVLESEITTKESLRKTSIARLGRLANEDLMSRDPAYRELGQRIQWLEAARLAGNSLQPAAGALHSALGHLLELDQQLQTLPAKRDQLEHSVRKLQDDLQVAERERCDLAVQLKQHADQHDAAARRAEQASSALAAAQRLHDAYQREHPPQAGIDSAASAGSSSALETEYSRLQAELQLAQSQLQIAMTPYEAIRQRSDEVKRRTESCQQQIAESLQLQESLAQQEIKLQREASRAQESIRPAVEQLQTLASRFSDAVKPLAWKSVIPLLDGVSLLQPHKGSGGISNQRVYPEQGRDTADQHSQDMTILTQFVETLQEQIKTLESDLLRCEGEWKKRWKDHCLDLLGEHLAEEVFSQSP